ncbi:hypothetical protein LXL04_023935 [Taraxacum kok-saghyz]
MDRHSVRREVLSRILERVKPKRIPRNSVRQFTLAFQLKKLLPWMSRLIDSLVAAAGVIGQEAGHFTDTRDDEIEQGITIKSTSTSLCYKMTEESLKGFRGERNGNKYLINLVDSPGHIELSSEVTTALRVTDGAMLVVDCIDGVRLQTESLLSQVYRERVVPVLTINKIDICFGELQVDGEKAYKSFQKVIASVNDNIVSRQDPLLGDRRVYPEIGGVAFSSGLYSGQTKTQGLGHANVDSFFLCYDRIKRVINLCIESEKELLWPILTKFDVTLSEAEKEFMGIELIDRVMKKWLPAANALLDMLSKTATNDSPLIAYVSKMICPRGNKGFLAFGHVDCPEDPYLHGEKQEVVEYVPCGNIVALDQFITKTTMLTSESWVYPVVRVRIFAYGYKHVSEHTKRLHIEALPLDISVVGAIEDGQIVTPVNPEDCKNILCEECGWYKRDIEKIRCLGPDASAPNMIVGKCNVDNHVKICIVGGFRLAVKHGALAAEAMWGRGHGHVFRSTKMQRFGAPLHKIIAYMPVRHAFGFSTELSNASANLGHATTAQCKFNHWEIINSDPMVDDTPANLIIRDVRRRKGLLEPMPQLADFEDIM